MYRKIVVGWDGSEQGRDALALAKQLRAADGSVVAACVYPDPGGMRARTNERGLIDSAAEVADQAHEVADQAHGDAREEWLSTRPVPGHSPAHGLHTLIEDESAELVVIGSSHRGELGQVLAGSGGHRLLTGSPCPVAVAPKGYRERIEGVRAVGVAYDGSKEAVNALREGASLASGLGAGLKLIGVVPPLQIWLGNGAFVPAPASDELMRARRDACQKGLDEAAESAADEVQASTEMIEGIPSVELVEAARQGVDLMVVGSRNYGPLRRVMMGSTALDLMRAAPCPVIVIPRGASTTSAESEPAAAATA